MLVYWFENPDKVDTVRRLVFYRMGVVVLMPKNTSVRASGSIEKAGR